MCGGGNIPKKPIQYPYKRPEELTKPIQNLTRGSKILPKK